MDKELQLNSRDLRRFAVKRKVTVKLDPLKKNFLR